VLYGSPDAMATDAVSRRSRAEEHVMKTEIRSLVEDSLALLREVRAGLHNESNRELVAALDEAIAMLEVILIQGPVRVDHTEKVLKVLGQGLAALPVLQRLIESLKD
jgi:hypothetical protein